MNLKSHYNVILPISSCASECTDSKITLYCDFNCVSKKQTLSLTLKSHYNVSKDSGRNHKKQEKGVEYNSTYLSRTGKGEHEHSL